MSDPITSVGPGSSGLGAGVGRIEAVCIRTKLAGRAVWAPIALLELYLALTVFIFFFGPVEWSLPNAPKLVIFLIINYGGLWMGYRWGTRRGRACLAANPGGGPSPVRLPSPLKLLILFSMGFTIVSTMSRLLAIRGGVGPVVETLLNPGEAYIQAQLIAQMDRDGLVVPIEKFSWAFRVSTLLAVFNSLYFPVTIVCWRWLSKNCRLLFFVALACSIVFSIGMGAQSGIGFMLFSLLPVALYKVFVERRSLVISQAGRIRVPSRRQTGRTALLAGAAFVMLVATVVFFQSDRAESSGQEWDSGDVLVGDHGSPATHGLPLLGNERITFGVVMLCKYVSHGYEGLALSMELPFKWTYGLGWSKALQVIARDYLGGPELFEKSYLARNEVSNDWPALWWWSTIFPWIASDTTYFGTVLFTLLVGFVIGRLWMDVILTGNPIGFAVLAQMFTLVFMFPANNALAQTLEGLFSLIGVLVIYGMSRRYFRRPAGGHQLTAEAPVVLALPKLGSARRG